MNRPRHPPIFETKSIPAILASSEISVYFISLRYKFIARPLYSTLSAGLMPDSEIPFSFAYFLNFSLSSSVIDWKYKNELDVLLKETEWHSLGQKVEQLFI